MNNKFTIGALVMGLAMLATGAMAATECTQSKWGG